MRFKKIGELPAFPSVNGSYSGSQAPTPELMADRLRIHFSARDTKGRSHPFFWDVSLAYPYVPIAPSGRTNIPLGKLGEGDESGVMISQVLPNEILYTGWNRGDDKVRYRTCCMSWNRTSGRKAMYFDRNPLGPVGTSMMIKHTEQSVFYMADQRWELNPAGNMYEPFYNIAYQYGYDGNYDQGGGIQEELDDKTGGIARPVIWQDKTQEDYLFYCKRGKWDYRTDKNESYRTYVKREYYYDDKPEKLVEIEGEDGFMIAYAYPITIDGKTYLLYNNHFQSQICVALLEE